MKKKTICKLFIIIYSIGLISALEGMKTNINLWLPAMMFLAMIILFTLVHISAEIEEDRMIANAQWEHMNYE